MDFELDCGWMRVAGRDPLDYFTKYPRRFPLIHVKDFAPAATGAAGAGALQEREGRPLGQGFIDYAPVLAAARRAGLKHYFAEQEGPFTRLSELDAARVAYEYLHALA